MILKPERNPQKIIQQAKEGYKWVMNQQAKKKPKWVMNQHAKERPKDPEAQRNHDSKPM